MWNHNNKWNEKETNVWLLQLKDIFLDVIRVVNHLHEWQKLLWSIGISSGTFSLSNLALNVISPVFSNIIDKVDIGLPIFSQIHCLLLENKASLQTLLSFIYWTSSVSSWFILVHVCSLVISFSWQLLLEVFPRFNVDWMDGFFLLLVHYY